MLLGCGLSLCTVLAAPVQAQYRVYNWGAYAGPATALSAEIRAEAELVRAYGEASLNLAQAREVRARAIRQEIANSVEYVKAYWERRSIYEAEKLKRYVAPLEAKKLRDSKTWERLKDHPELNGPAIIEGTAQNFLLNRLAGGVLAYKFSFGQQQHDPETLKQLDLPPTILHQIRLKQALPNGQFYVFRADEGTALKIDWWPFLLQDSAFTTFRTDFDKARQTAVNEAKQGRVSSKSLKDLMQVLDELDAKFQKVYDRDFRQKSRSGFNANFQHYLVANRFIQSLAGEILRLQTTGDAKAFDGTLKFTGNNLVELLTYMSRNGLLFAPAQPGEESSYQQIFHMLRDLYVTVATDEK